MVNDATYPFQSGHGIASLQDEHFITVRNDCEYLFFSCIISMDMWKYAQRQSGTFYSEVFDAGGSKNWWTVFWTGVEPEGIFWV